MTDLQTVTAALVAALALYGLAREAWRHGWLPIQCANCHRLAQHRHSRNVLHAAAGWVRMCDGCYTETYPGGL